MSNSWQTLFFVIILLSSISVIPLTSASVSIDKTYLSPKKQVAYGASPENVVCLDGLVLMKKLSDNSPACVKPDTAQKLVERGWGVLKEQLVWFEFVPIQCQKTPWINWSMNFSRVGSEAQWIKWYFKDQGITILDAKQKPPPAFAAGQPPPCGSPSYTVFYFLVPQNDTSKMIELGFKAVDEKEVQGSEILLPNITNTEQKIWFEFVPIQCHAPWDEYWFHNSPLANTTRPYTEGTVINYYFTNNGITIFDAKYLPKLTTAQERMPRCGDPSETPFYFLVSESDSDKMTKLGYKLAKIPLPSYAYSVPFSFNSSANR